MIEIGHIFGKNRTHDTGKLALLTSMENFAEKTASRKLKAVKAMFAEAHAEGYSLTNPVNRLEVAVKTQNKSQKQTKRPFTLDEIKNIIENASDEWRSMVYFGLYTGQRLGDLATLRWSNLNLKDNLFTIYTSKTGRKIDIPFSETLLDHILTLKAPKDPDAFVHPTLGVRAGQMPLVINLATF